MSSVCLGFRSPCNSPPPPPQKKAGPKVEFSQAIKGLQWVGGRAILARNFDRTCVLARCHRAVHVDSDISCQALTARSYQRLFLIRSLGDGDYSAAAAILPVDGVHQLLHQPSDLLVAKRRIFAGIQTPAELQPTKFVVTAAIHIQLVGRATREQGARTEGLNVWLHVPCNCISWYVRCLRLSV